MVAESETVDSWLLFGEALSIPLANQHVSDLQSLLGEIELSQGFDISMRSYARNVEPG